MVLAFESTGTYPSSICEWEFVKIFLRNMRDGWNLEAGSIEPYLSVYNDTSLDSASMEGDPATIQAIGPWTQLC